MQIIFTKENYKVEEICLKNIKDNMSLVQRVIADSLQIEDEYKLNYRNEYYGRFKEEIPSYLAKVASAVASSKDGYCTAIAGSIMNPLISDRTGQKIWMGWILEVSCKVGLITYKLEKIPDPRNEEFFGGKEIYAPKERGVFLLEEDSILLRGILNIPTLERGLNIPNTKAKHKAKVLGNPFQRRVKEIAAVKNLWFDQCDETLEIISSAPLHYDPNAKGIKEWDPDSWDESDLLQGESIKDMLQRKQEEWNYYGAKVSAIVKQYIEEDYIFFNDYANDGRGRLYPTNDVGNHTSIKSARAIMKVAIEYSIDIPEKYAKYRIK